MLDPSFWGEVESGRTANSKSKKYYIIPDNNIILIQTNYDFNKAIVF